MHLKAKYGCIRPQFKIKHLVFNSAISIKLNHY